MQEDLTGEKEGGGRGTTWREVIVSRRPSESELDLQLRWYKRRLLFLLRTSGLDHRCAVLEFRRGELLDALGEHTRELHMEKLVQ